MMKGWGGKEHIFTKVNFDDEGEGCCIMNEVFVWAGLYFHVGCVTKQIIKFQKPEFIFRYTYVLGAG